MSVFDILIFLIPWQSLTSLSPHCLPSLSVTSLSSDSVWHLCPQTVIETSVLTSLSRDSVWHLCLWHHCPEPVLDISVPRQCLPSQPSSHGSAALVVNKAAVSLKEGNKTVTGIKQSIRMLSCRGQGRDRKRHWLLLSLFSTGETVSLYRTTAPGQQQDKLSQPRD